MKLRIYATAFLLIIFYFASPSGSAVIEGIVLSEDGPLEDSTVHAYSKFRDIKNGSPEHVSGPGDKKGLYKMNLPSGTYYLTASGRRDGKNFFSYHGANPIRIEGHDLWVPIMAVPETTAVINESLSAKLTGKVTFKGAPVKGAQVSIYPLPGLTPNSELQTPNSNFRGMGFLTSTTDENGTFVMSPEAGEYVIIARNRNSHKGMRPLEKGDLFCYFAGNPVATADSKETRIEIPCYPKDDLKAFLNEKAYPMILVKKSGGDSVRFRENKLEQTADVLKIQGRVTALPGGPAKGLYVMAYGGKPADMFQMHYVRTMPDYMVRTDDNGHYSIETSGKGTYYIVARELIGEAPVKGEYYGLYEGNANHFVTVDENSLKDVNIVVSRVMWEYGRKSEVRSQKSEVKKIHNYFYTGDVVIDKDTAWDGEIIIDGIVHVARGVTLMINPGTTIKFKKIDRNGDGVGDAMLKVGGRLVAEGAPDKMIRFTSGEERPERMDWSYLLFFVSGDESIIRHCMFEYAFTGVQAHFSKAVISDSAFTNNREGIRFGRAELHIEHNDLFENGCGIRHTRVEEPVVIRYNNIKNNGVGIFLVPSNQNVNDFSVTFDKKGTFPPKQFIVTHNNISYNTEYNYRLGERQGYDILLKDNWWGAAKEMEILDTIYDEKTDNSLGGVIYKPYFTSPVKNAGMRKEAR
ncbi:MAG: right-handed parallel beta-helix repeat-containing protein [Nitrospirae bacterium]|nr:right-handed parallel beta-helix repeat-containing protein [Nitrospirota bacterium]